MIYHWKTGRRGYGDVLHMVDDGKHEVGDGTMRVYVFFPDEDKCYWRRASAFVLIDEQRLRVKNLETGVVGYRQSETVDGIWAKVFFPELRKCDWCLKVHLEYAIWQPVRTTAAQRTAADLRASPGDS